MKALPDELGRRGAPPNPGVFRSPSPFDALQPPPPVRRVTIVHVANIVFSLCATLGALLIAIPSAVKGRWAVAVVFGLLALGFLLRARAGYRRGEWQ
jgi:hypothetical protein